MLWRRKKPEPLFSIAQATEHILITGRPGAGKTSAFLKRIMLELIAQGAFCMGCCVKPDEADRLARLLPKRTIRFSPTSGHIFNPLTYTMARKGARHLATFHDDLTEVLTRSTNDHTESFWKSGVTDLLMAAFELSYLVRGEHATYRDCLDIIMNVPVNPEHAASEMFRMNPCGQFLEQGLAKNSNLTMPIADFLLKRLPCVGDKARGAFVTQAATSLQPFVTPPLCQALNGKSTLTPSMMVGGYTILDFDSLTHGINGLAYQLMCSWFAMEEVLARRSWKRPFILLRDEFPELAHRRCKTAFAAGRSQGFIGLSALQTLPAFENSLGGGIEAQTLAKSLWGLHTHRVYCNNSCHITNEFAAESIGKERKMFFGGSNSPDPGQNAWYDVLGVGQRPSFSFNQQFHYRVDPLEFTRLRTGGKANDYLVDAIITRGTNDFEFSTVSQRYR